MFAGCSEIGVSVIAKHGQHVGIIRAFCQSWGNLFRFSVSGRGQEIFLGCGLQEGIRTQADTMISA